MKKLKDRIKKARAQLSIKTYKKPRIFVILTMIFINLVILVIAAFIALIIDDSFSNIIDAFANGSLKWMLTPNAILALENPQTLFLGVLVLITGLVLFSGTIIALTTNAIKDYFEKKQSGSGKIHLEHHIVILNWNNKVPELVADLLYVQSKSVTLMILADVEKAYAEKQILNAVKAVKKETSSLSNLNVLVKRGDPLVLSDLTDISIQAADAILIMNKDVRDVATKELTYSDLNVIKVILSLGSLAFEYNPTIVAEVKMHSTKEKVETLSQVVESLTAHHIIPICFDRRLGQIMAQTIIEKHTEDVYLSLFSFEGSEVYAVKDCSFEDYLKSYSHGIPLAQEDDVLYVLAPNNKLKHTQSNHAHEPLKLNFKGLKERSTQDVTIIGDNNKQKFILEAFQSYENLHKSSFHATHVSSDDLETTIEKIKASNTLSTVLLLSDETASPATLDANVINTLIHLQNALKGLDSHIIVELLDPKNDTIIKDFNIENTIISNKIISLLLSKLALFPETADFYEHLLTIAPSKADQDDYAITIQTAQAMFEMESKLRFKSKKQLIESVYLSSKKTLMLIGLVRNDEVMVLAGDLHKAEDVTIDKDDLCIFMKL